MGGDPACRLEKRFCLADAAVGAGTPLVYFRGRYGALAQEAPPGIEGRRTTDKD